MIPEDDFLLAKPARKETVTVVRIALIALMGCLLLMAALMIQARAEPDAVLQRQIKVINQIETSQAPIAPASVGQSPAGKPTTHPMSVSPR